jgi:ankyrin repeat protein
MKSHCELFKDALRNEHPKDVTEYLFNKTMVTTDISVNSIFIDFCQEKNIPISALKFLIGKGANIDYKNYIGTTPVMFAAQNNDLKKVKFLLKEGCIIEYKNENGNDVYHYAVASGNNEIINLLKSIKHNKFAEDYEKLWNENIELKNELKEKNEKLEIFQSMLSSDKTFINI